VAFLGVFLIGCVLTVGNRSDPADTSVETVIRERTALADANQRSVDGLRVVTYNVHGSSADALLPIFREREDLAKADVILLQEIEDYAEVGGSEASQLAAALGMSHSYAPGYGIGDAGSHGVAILSRLPLSDVEVIELPRYHVVVNSARRVALGATVGVGSKSLRVYSVHLDNRINPSDRRAQLAPVFTHALARPELAVVVGGDLNTSPFCWVGHLVPIPCPRQSSALEALARSRGFETPAVHSGPTSKWLDMRLDALYTRGLVAKRVAVEDNVSLSDHFPLRVDVQLGEQP